MIKHDPAAHRFEADLEEHTAFMKYRLAGDSIVFEHTEVPAALEGRGLGSQLARAGLEHARSAKLNVVPLCPFVANYIRRHPEYLDLVPQRYRDRMSD